jgi:hypothetical protein
VAVGNDVVERPAWFKTPGGGVYRRTSSGASKNLSTTHDAGNAYPVRSANANTAE